MGRCVHLLTRSVVANPLNKRIVWNRCAVVGCNASPEKHHKILSRLTWLQTRGRGSRRKAWGCGRWRRWSRGLLRHCVRYQKCCDGQQDENAHAVVHKFLHGRETSDAKSLGPTSVQVKTPSFSLRTSFFAYSAKSSKLLAHLTSQIKNNAKAGSQMFFRKRKAHQAVFTYSCLRERSWPSQRATFCKAHWHCWS